MNKINFKYDNRMMINNKINDLSDAITDGFEQFKKISIPFDFNYSEPFTKINTLFSENDKYIEKYSEAYDKTLLNINKNLSNLFSNLTDIFEDNLTLIDGELEYIFSSTNSNSLNVKSSDDVKNSNVINDVNIYKEEKEGEENIAISDVSIAMPSIYKINSSSNKNINSAHINSDYEHVKFDADKNAKDKKIDIEKNNTDVKIKNNNKTENSSDLEYETSDNKFKYNNDFKFKQQEDISTKNIDSNFKLKNNNISTNKPLNIELGNVNSKNNFNSKIDNVNKQSEITIDDIETYFDVTGNGS